ncbi:Os11g0540050 [Oryza sativa Japonica Group]|uniref:Os11g0540050 protein n=1 Tax=Oryza sativa subsp. japonica TaxID=39947 RepID=A0A0P0Y364_ORYSJ|nr:Os11g0540050 [Oryza sativa Japonica Group]
MPGDKRSWRQPSGSSCARTPPPASISMATDEPMLQATAPLTTYIASRHHCPQPSGAHADYHPGRRRGVCLEWKALVAKIRRWIHAARAAIHGVFATKHRFFFIIFHNLCFLIKPVLLTSPKLQI